MQRIRLTYLQSLYYRRALSSKALDAPGHDVAHRYNSVRYRAYTASNPTIVSSARDAFSSDVLDPSTITNLKTYAKIAFHDKNSDQKGTTPVYEPYENNYCFQYIHKRLHDKFKGFEDLIKTNPIYDDICKLAIMCEKSEGEADVINPNSEDHAKSELKNQLIQSISERLSYLTQPELCSLFMHISPNLKWTEFRPIGRRIDSELRWILKGNIKTQLQDLDLWLYMSDLFYEARWKSYSSHVLLNYITELDSESITNKQFIHMLFLVILKRQQDRLLWKYEERMCSILDEEKLEDAAVISMAYFKTTTKVTNLKLQRKLIHVLEANLSSLDPYQPGYASIIKCLRYSRRDDVDLRSQVSGLAEALLSEENINIVFASQYNAMQTLKLFESYKVYRPTFIEHLWKYMNSNIKTIRVKDFQYTLSSLSNFGFDLSGSRKLQMDRMITQLFAHLDQDESRILPYFGPLARALIVMNYYNDKLIDYIHKLMKDPERFEIAFSGVEEITRTYLLLHSATHIEHPNNKLVVEPDLLQKLNNMVDRRNIVQGRLDNGKLAQLRAVVERPHPLELSNAYKTLALQLKARPEICGDDYNFAYQTTMAFQNYSDMVISYKSTNPGDFDPVTLYPKVVAAGEKHLILLILTRFDFVDGLSRVVGYKLGLRRLLEALGYRVLMVNVNSYDLDKIVSQVKLIFATNV